MLKINGDAKKAQCTLNIDKTASEMPAIFGGLRAIRDLIYSENGSLCSQKRGDSLILSLPLSADYAAKIKTVTPDSSTY